VTNARCKGRFPRQGTAGREDNAHEEARSRQEALADGTQIDSQVLIDDVPVFVAAARDILASLTDAQRAKVRIPEGLFALRVAEATKLRDRKRAHEADMARAAGGKAGREAELRAVMREGIDERDLCYDSIRNALGSRRMGEVDALVGRADSPEALAIGCTALADFLDTTHALSDRAAVRLDDDGADHACASGSRRSSQREGSGGGTCGAGAWYVAEENDAKAERRQPGGDPRRSPAPAPEGAGRARRDVAARRRRAGRQRRAPAAARDARDGAPRALQSGRRA
jgi:hypothetical protein